MVYGNLGSSDDEEHGNSWQVLLNYTPAYYPQHKAVKSVLDVQMSALAPALLNREAIT